MGRKRTVSQKLSELNARVAKWRERHGGRGSRIPDELWRDAVTAARTEGVRPTAQALRLNRNRLKDHMVRADGGGNEKLAKASLVQTAARRRNALAHRNSDGTINNAAGASFVALDVCAPGGRTVIDLVGRHGDRLHVEVMGGVDLCGLIERVWGRRP